MKRFIITALAVVLIATPAWAAVTISDSNDGCEVTLSYSVTGPNNVRAFALDITVDSGATIDSISNLNTQYDIYPGSIVIVGGAVTDDGNAIGDSAIYAGTLGGLGTGGMTIEMGSLYVGAANEPNASGVLCKFVVSADCNVSVAENVIRAGVVMENPDEDPGLSLPSTLLVTGCTISDCLIGGNADQGLPAPLDTEYNTWASWSKPDCWCYQFQCRGDVDGHKLGPYQTQLADLNVFKLSFNKPDAVLTGVAIGHDKGICADFDHKKLGPYRVQLNDLNILKAYFNKPYTSTYPCDVTDATHGYPTLLTGPFNFWITAP